MSERNQGPTDRLRIVPLDEAGERGPEHRVSIINPQDIPGIGGGGNDFDIEDNVVVRGDTSPGSPGIQGNTAVSINDAGLMTATVPISSYNSAVTGQAFGAGATASGSGTAVGNTAVAGSGAVAVGRDANAEASGVAVGRNAESTEFDDDDRAVAIGAAATATGTGVTVGGNSSAETAAVALGYFVVAPGDIIAIGQSINGTGIDGSATYIGQSFAPGPMLFSWVNDLNFSTGFTRTVFPDGVADVNNVLSGMFVVHDDAGNVAGGQITPIIPGGTFDLIDDGGTNTLELQVAANGTVTVSRTAGTRSYVVSLNLIWL